MNRHPFRLVAAGLLALAAMAAATPASASPGATAGAADRAPAVSSDTVLSVRGAGPYRIGARQQRLADAGLLDWVAGQPGCNVVHAGATGDWAGVILLAFRDGRL